MEEKRRQFFANTEFYRPDQMGIEESDPKHRFGDVAGVPVLTTFADRKECARRGVHLPTQAGIWGSSERGAYSIFLSGEYEDDEDNGDKIIYTGTGNAEEDQNPYYRDNAAMFKSAETRRPVRVIRSEKFKKSDWAPAHGIRYDGLYVVKDARMAKGRNKHKICRFELERLPDQPDIPKKR